jgi:signal peptidase I
LTFYKKMEKQEFKRKAKKVWWFIWDSNSVWSWIVNIILAFIIIKFLVYPGLGFAFGTSHPIVAVVSGSMEHSMDSNLNLCDKTFNQKQSINFDSYWDSCGQWYETNVNITKQEFQTFKFHNGFNKGDIIILMGTPVEKIIPGDIIVFSGYRPDPIIHRVVKNWEQNDIYYFQTKGDHNAQTFAFESKIPEQEYIGRAVVKVPYLGYIKIGAVELFQLFIK